MSIIKDGGFVQISVRPYQVIKHLTHGKLHHKSLIMPKQVGAAERYIWYMNQEGYILLEPIR